ncbi:MAG: ATP-binding cassette domain-containing protein, partial [Bacteriovoracales bacterium]
MYIIEADNLSKSYGKIEALKNFSLGVEKGSCFALLGPNGAGKTTSFYQVVGLVKPDEGEVFLDDLN